MPNVFFMVALSAFLLAMNAAEAVQFTCVSEQAVAFVETKAIGVRTTEEVEAGRRFVLRPGTRSDTSLRRIPEGFDVVEEVGSTWPIVDGPLSCQIQSEEILCTGSNIYFLLGLRDERFVLAELNGFTNGKDDEIERRIFLFPRPQMMIGVCSETM
jgi:hypothetical protein